MNINPMYEPQACFVECLLLLIVLFNLLHFLQLHNSG